MSAVVGVGVTSGVARTATFPAAPAPTRDPRAPRSGTLSGAANDEAVAAATAAGAR